jgi:Predicted membrane protein (DUF2207) C-terminal domain/Predicted membrane protein (DUF2207) N-terminal domain
VPAKPPARTRTRSAERLLVRDHAAPYAPRVRRLVALSGLALCALVLGAGPARAQEHIPSYDVDVTIAPNGTIEVAETIDYDFDPTPHHGIYRDVPTTLAFDDRYDRVFPLHVDSVRSATAPDGFTIEDAGDGLTRIRIGDPDQEITGEHVYEIRYRMDGTLNAFSDHLELYWNATGDQWEVAIDRVTVAVHAPAPIERVACFTGPSGATDPCAAVSSEGTDATFRARRLFPFEGISVVVALPRDAVTPTPAPILRERQTFANEFRVTPIRGGFAGVLALALLGWIGVTQWRSGRDRRFRGSPIDQVMGGSGGDETVPIGDADTSAPVEFAPPDGLRPGQIGTLIDERANTLDVTATIIDLAVRGFLTIQEIPKEGWFGKPDWRLIKLEKDPGELLPYERSLLDGLFHDGDEVLMSSLRATFADRLRKVEEKLYGDVVEEGWFLRRPDRVRTNWTALAICALIGSVILTWVLARVWRIGIVGVPFVLASLLLWWGAKRMPSRTAKGTAMLRRIRGFQTVIDKAETNMARWAEQENVFTRYLPYAIVFGLTEKWAKAFEGLGAPEPDATTWYVGTRPFVYGESAHSIDGFTVATSGIIAATPAGSGGSGFSGGGVGGGGGGSW